MKKVVYTLNIDNAYAPGITALTYPLIQRWASKICADFQVITKRKFPNTPVVYEKLQIYELGKHNDWNIYVDSDTIVHPDMFDITEHLYKDTVFHHGNDMAGNRWRYDNYFRRDGRHIGSCNWLTIASDWCIDLWHPLDDITIEQAVANIYPTQNELNTVITSEHLIDDYTLSRNIAKYGLKFTSFLQLLAKLNDNGSYFWHQYLLPASVKAEEMKKVLIAWGVAV